MLALSAVAGLVAAWWLFPLGLLLWLLMVVVVSRDPSLRFRHRMRRRKPLAHRFQAYFSRIERLQVRVFNSLAPAPAGTRKALQPVQQELEALAEQVYELCRGLTALENYLLVSESTTNLSAELRRTEEAIDRASDPLVKREYEESREAVVERIAKRKQAASELDRVEAQLVSLANDLDGIVAEVLRLQAEQPAEVERQAAELAERIRAQPLPRLPRRVREGTED
jgi:hypothetical protein